MSNLDALLAQLKAKKVGKRWSARCPAHEDSSPSLSISEGSEGRVLLKCHAGCTVDAIRAALGASWSDLFAESTRSGSPRRNEPRAYLLPADAIAAVLRGLGPPWRHVRTFRYESPTGAHLLSVARFEDGAGNKTFRPISHNGIGWILADPSGPLPIYGLPLLRDAALVLLVEGEGCADTVRELGLVPTTSPHGAKSARRADWTSLAGKRVAILPDNDEPGKAYAAEVAEILLALTPPARVSIVELPDLGDGEDVVDFVRVRRERGVSDEAIRGEVLALVEGARSVEPEADEPAVGRFTPFPLEALPPSLRSFVEYASEAAGSDASFVSVPMLAVLAGAIGNAVEIELREGWREPCILWTAIVGPSGAHKSPALAMVKSPLKRLQARERAAHREAMRTHAAQRSSSDRSVESVDGSSEREPHLRRYFVADVTMEALGSILAKQETGLIVLRDELSGWVRSFNQYKARGGDDEARWLELWSADSLSIERRTGEERSLFVEHPAVSITGGIQPEILREVFTRSRQENGLLARLLFTMPPTVPARWNPHPGDAHHADRFAEVLERLASTPVPSDADRTPRRAIVRLSPDAAPLWGPFYEETQARALEFDEHGGATWAKLAGTCARIALVLELAKWAAEAPGSDLPTEIARDTLASAIRLAHWFGAEALRVHALLGSSDAERELDRFEERISVRGGSVSVRDWHRMRSKRSASEARAELQRLVDAKRARWDQRSGTPPRILVLLRGDAKHGPPPDAAQHEDQQLPALSGPSVSDSSGADPHAGEERAAIREADGLPAHDGSEGHGSDYLHNSQYPARMEDG